MAGLFGPRTVGRWPGVLLRTSAVVVTVPVSVLKNAVGSSNCINFSPEIDQKRPMLDKIEIGSARRVTLAFKQKWWEEPLKKIDPARSELGFLFGQNVPVSVWWQNEPSNMPMLTGWIGGPKAIEMEKLENEQFIDIAVTSLSRIFQTGESAREFNLLTVLRTTGKRPILVRRLQILVSWEPKLRRTSGIHPASPLLCRKKDGDC